MPTFQITTPDGKSYEVEGATAEGALAALQKHTTVTQPYSGGILPLSKDAQGNVSFDSNAGILGTLKRAFTLPGEVYRGEIDPMSDQGIGRAAEMGLVVSPMNPGVRSGDLAIPGVRRAVRAPDVAPPSAAMLKGAATAGYDRVRGMDVLYSSDAVRRMAEEARSALDADGILAELAPKTHSILLKLSRPPENSVVTSAGLEAARRALGNAGKDFANPTEQLASHRVTEALGKFTENPDPQDVVAGPAAAAGEGLAQARANYAAGKRSDKLNGIEENADRRAKATNSGLNIDNTLRQRVASLLQSPKTRAGFSADELAALEQVARGTPTRNAVRIVGNLLGGGGGLGAVVSGVGLGAGGGAAFGVVPGVAIGAGVPAAGMIARASANAMTRRALEEADKLTRRRSPLYEQMKNDAGMDVLSPARRAAVAAMVRALTLDRGPPNEQRQ